MLNAPSLLSFMPDTPSPAPMIADLASGLSRARAPRPETPGPEDQKYGQDDPAHDDEGGRPVLREPGVELLEPLQRLVAVVRPHRRPERVPHPARDQEGQGQLPSGEADDARGHHEDLERHGWRKDRGYGQGEHAPA